VLQACGSPAQGSVIDEQIKRGRNTAEEVSSTPGAQLEKLVSVFRWCTVAVFAPEPRLKCIKWQPTTVTQLLILQNVTNISFKNDYFLSVKPDKIIRRMIMMVI